MLVWFLGLIFGKQYIIKFFCYEYGEVGGEGNVEVGEGGQFW